MPVSKSVGQQIADEFNSLKEIDVESDAHLSDEQDNSSDEHITSHYDIPLESSKLRRLNFELNDSKYGGKQVSRKELVSSDEDHELDDFDSDDEHDTQSEADDDASFKSMDEFENDMDADDTIATELSKMKQDEESMLNRLSSSTKSDIQKGKHVRNQLNLWDTSLDLRIRLQKAVDSANRMPLADSELYSHIHSSSDDKTSVAEAVETACSFLFELTQLRAELMGMQPSISIPNLSNMKKRKRPSDWNDLDTMWNDYLDPLDSGFEDFRSETIEKWNNKVQMASGVPLQKKFKVLNQSVVKQIQHLLSDQDRLVKRTQLRRSRQHRFGETSKPTTSSGTSTEPSLEKSTENVDAHLADYDFEIFDDGDYYQQLLKELIESRLTDTNDPILQSMQYAHLKSLQEKNKKAKKKLVDTKASKGRKVRYHVHEKLQNFMAAEPRGTWHDEMAQELFCSLFGQLTSVDAVAQEPKTERIVADEGISLNLEDGFKLF